MRNHKSMRQMFMAALSDADAGHGNRFKDKVRVIRNCQRVSIMTKFSDSKNDHDNKGNDKEGNDNDVHALENLDNSSKDSEKVIQNQQNMTLSEFEGDDEKIEGILALDSHINFDVDPGNRNGIDVDSIDNAMWLELLKD